MTTYIAYGNGNEEPEIGFPEEQDFLAYIKERVFTHCRSRYQYSHASDSNIIVLTRHAKAYGHFEIERWENPNSDDLIALQNAERTYIVKKSVLYKQPVRLFDVAQIRVGHQGKAFGQREFEMILEAAGGVEEFPRIETKYCRLCFNDQNWWNPAGVAVEGDTYYGKNGFGHEEWLFRYEWCIGGLKYGFLQPVNLYLKNNQGKTLSLILTTTHLGKTYFVGLIKKVYIPHDDDLADAAKQFEANGWLETMKSEVNKVGGVASALGNNKPNQILNVQFDPADVVLADELTIFQDGQKPTRATYYNLYDDEGEPLPPLTYPRKTKLPINRRKEIQYERAAQQGTVVNPRHYHIQNRLYDTLCDQHGADKVGYEIADVDLRVTLPSNVTFFEIKTDCTAKSCIRSALGQLFEYTSYPAESKADKWVVVGEAPVTKSDREYLAHLRKTYGLPLFYAQFDWATGSLKAEV